MCYDGIVVDACLHLGILVGEALVFIFHLLLVKFGEFLHLLIGRFLLFQVFGKIEHYTCEEHDDDDKDGDDDFLVHEELCDDCLFTFR